MLATASAAVGLGNLWRFPYLAGENGGGAFVIAYLIAILAIGIPIMLLEVSAGRFTLGSPVASFRSVHRHAAIVGWLVVLLTVVITSYYIVITGWTLGYAVDSIRGEVRQFDEFTSGYASFWYFLLIGILLIGVLMRGVAGVERLARYLMPPLLITVVVLVIYGFTLDGWGEATRFLLEADFSRFTEPGLWLVAVGQAFYSLAIGQGYLMTYGSYAPKNLNVPRASVVVAGTETMIALLAGWMLFPLVFTFGLSPDEGSAIAFDTLPTAFESLGIGWLLALLFFPLFFAAAFSSCIAGMKVIITSVRDELDYTLRRAVLLCVAAVMLLGIPSALTFSPLEVTLLGEPFLEAMDRVGATQVVVTSGIIGATLLGWFVPRHRFEGALDHWYLPWPRIVIYVARAVPFLALFGLLVWLVG